MKIKPGIWPTMITPFTVDNQIDEAALATQVEWYIKSGCDGLFAVCQSSEMFFLTLEERVRLARRCVELAAGRIGVIASGHISDALAEQIAEIKAVWETGIDAFVLVSNRLAKEDESDDVWIANAQQIIDALPDVTFGMYECPYPYKRLLSAKTLRWMVESGRFTFIKDTCCDAAMIRQRLDIIRAHTPKGTEPMGLYNANTMTLLESLRDGADGFCGVMGNFHPELYQWMFSNYRKEPVKANDLQAALTVLSSLESQAYPVCAKKHMQDIGVPFTLETRTISSSRFGYMQAETLRQAEQLENMLRRLYVNGRAYMPRWHSKEVSSFAWTQAVPYPTNPEEPQGLERSIIHRPGSQYPFLHDTMIAQLNGRLFCAWYNCSEDEIVGDTLIRGRWSDDGGVTWGAPEIVAKPKGDSGTHMVPAAFAQIGDQCYAYITEMISHDRPIGFSTYQRIGMKWRKIAHSDQPVLFNMQPVQIAGGMLMSAGRMSAQQGELPHIPCVMTCDPHKPSEWSVQPLPGPWNYGCEPLLFPETTLIADAKCLTAVTRNDGGAAQVFESYDLGKTWTEPKDIGLPVGPVKTCGGILPDGQQYLIYNDKQVAGRERLVIALRRSSDDAFDRVYTVFERNCMDVGPMWHYPCAVVYDDKLLISCTASEMKNVRRYAVLAAIPLVALE